MEEHSIYGQCALNSTTNILVVRTFIINSMEDKPTPLVENVLSSRMDYLPYHSIQDGLDQQNKPNFSVEENLEVNPLHVFDLKGVFARQGRSFEVCNLTPT